MRQRLLSVGVMMSALLLGPGCASVREQQRLEETTREYVYPRPLHEVWPAAKSFVSSKGYSYRTGLGTNALVTEWREHFHGSRVASEYSRLLVQGIAHKDGTSRVLIWRQTMSTGGLGRPSDLENLSSRELVRPVPRNEGDPLGMRRSGTRDLKMEFELMQSLQPRDAEALAARVKQGDR